MHLSPDQERLLQELLRVFLEENRRLNLSAYRTEGACWVGNVLDSIAALDVLSAACSRPEDSDSGSTFAPSGAMVDKSGSERRCRVMDVGTGGGFPLLPLALLLPQMEFTGLDATKKKVDAVERMIGRLQVAGFRCQVRLLVGRAEELGHDPNVREQFDVVLGRAVAELPTLLEFLSPFARVRGKILCWKSLAIEEELQASVTARMQLQCRLVGRHEYELPDDWGKRQMLIFEKVKTLPKEFPRKTGVPKKDPIL